MALRLAVRQLSFGLACRLLAGVRCRSIMLMVVLGPSLGRYLAVALTLVLRLVWIAAELPVAAALSAPWSDALAGPLAWELRVA